MLVKIISVILLNIALFGSGLDVFSSSFHGHFCGKETPKLDYANAKEEIKILSKIAPIDVIDEACKKHDICYLEKGSGNKSCDDQLVLSMKNMKKKFHNKNCRILSKAIVFYFDTKNYNPITLLNEDYSNNDKLKEMPILVAENMFDMGSLVTDMAINFGYSKPTGYLFDSKNNKQRRKEVFWIFPPRYKVCLY